MKLALISSILCLSISIQAQETIEMLTKVKAPKAALPHPTFVYHESPIQIQRGKILVKGKVDNKAGYFIIDTGAPGIVINQNVANTNATEQALGINGSVAIANSFVAKLEWAGIKRKDLEVLSIDLSHLENAIQKPILGLIGHEELKNYAIIFDLRAKKMIIDQGQPSRLHQHFAPEQHYSFTLVDHLPVIEFKIGTDNYIFGIDTGAGSNLLDKQINEEVTTYLTPVSIAEIQGLDQKIEKVQKLQLNAKSLANHSLFMQYFLSVDLSFLEESSTIAIDGLLGFPFLQEEKFAIDFRQKQLLIW